MLLPALSLFGQDGHKFGSGNHPIPVYYGMIYRQLPAIEKAASKKTPL